MNPTPLDRLDFDAAELVVKHPPLWDHFNKKVVYDISCPAGSTHAGRLTYSRWAPMTLPATVVPAAAAELVEVRADVYDYSLALARAEAVEWHVNFADPNLFVAYSSALLAQDELQVAEHPALGSLLEALLARGMRAVTVEDRRPTPVLVSGVERRCRIATDANAAEGRPGGLYGGMFSLAHPEVVRRATQRIEPPTISHIIAMAAPNGGDGAYRTDEIRYVLSTAFTGFGAALIESSKSRGSSAPIVVHSGFWGCGVFGGNRVLMTLLQMLAAQMAGVTRLVLHTVDRTGVGPVNEARSILSRQFGSGAAEMQKVLEGIEKMGFVWGVGDGN